MIRIYSVCLCSIVFSTMLLANENTNNYFIGGSLDYQRIYNHSPKLIDTSLTQDNLGGLTVLFGYKKLFSSYISNKDFSFDIEGRITKSFWNESFAESMRYSLFTKPKYNIYNNNDNNQSINIYGLLGFGKLTVEGHNGEAPADANTIGTNIYSDVSFQWGLGINIDVSEKLSLFIDYTSLIKDEDIDSTLYASDSKVYKELSSDAISVGVTYAF